MKKLVILICILVIYLLSSCAMDPGSYYFDSDSLLEEVIRVELVQYDNPDQKHFKSWAPNHFPDLASFLPQNMTKLEELANEKIDDFLNQLSEENILYKYYAYNSPNGLCIKLVYANEDFEILNCNVEKKSYTGYIGRYSSEGEIIDFKGVFYSYTSFETLVNDYFSMSI